MLDIITLAGSPSVTSRSAAILDYARAVIERAGLRAGAINIRQLPAEDLFFTRTDSAAIRHSRDLVQQAAGVVIATPIYKAAYSGLLKLFLDLLPANAFEGKIVLPLATGGSLAHFLAIDYSLRPVLAALGATHILSGVYLLDSQVQWQNGQLIFENGAQDRLQAALQALMAQVKREPVLEETR